MDRHTCKLCFRRFHNGRALGGHMRSHVMAAAAAAAAAAASYSPPPPQQQSPPLSLASTSSTEMDGKPAQQKPLSYVLRENPKKSYKVGAPEFSGWCGGGVAGGESSVVQDGESDTESPPGGAGFAVSRLRSKRVRRRPPPPASDPEPASSISDATTEQDVAMSLVLLSRDSWTRSRSEPSPHSARASSEAEQNNDNVNVFDEDDRAVAGEDYEEYYGKATAARPRSRYQFGACKKVFRSYQALGGHRTSLKKGNGGCVPPPVRRRPRPAARTPLSSTSARSASASSTPARPWADTSAHMSSGGALAPPTPSPSPAKCSDSFGSFDLNVPAATDDDCELSAVYDAEFGSTRQ